MSRKGKIRKEDLPYTALPTATGGFRYTAHCHKPGCDSSITIHSAKRIPSTIVIKEIKQKGWQGSGTLDKGIPRYLICSKCLVKRASAILPAPSTPNKQENHAMSTPRNKITVWLHHRYYSPASNKKSSATLSILNKEMIGDDIEKWFKGTKAARCLIEYQAHSNRFYLQINKDLTHFGLKLLNRYGNFTVNTTGLLERLAIPKKQLRQHLHIPLTFEVNVENDALFGNVQVSGTSNETRDDVLERIKTDPRVARTTRKTSAHNYKSKSPTSSAIPDNHTLKTSKTLATPKIKEFSLNDGRALADMFNDWMARAQSQGWDVTIQTDKNGKIKLNMTSM